MNKIYLNEQSLSDLQAFYGFESPEFLDKNLVKNNNFLQDMIDLQKDQDFQIK